MHGDHNAIRCRTLPPMSERPGRNDLCHCGSGNKYKKCCIEKDEAARVAAAATTAAAAPPVSVAPPAKTGGRAAQQAPKPGEANRKMAPAARRRSV